MLIAPPKPRPALAAPDYDQGPLPLVSIICAVYGQRSYTEELVRSLEQNAGTPYELILADNACPEGTGNWAEARGLKVVRMGRNAGVPEAYNAGVKAASGGILAFWNNDMVCHRDGVKRLALACRKRGLATQTGGHWTTAGQYAGTTEEREWSDYAEGYCVTFTREVWDTVGIWDPTFFPSYSDDVDWTLRARLKGFDWELVPGCVTHFGQATSKHFDLSGPVARHQEIIRDRYLKLGIGQRLLVQRWGAIGDLLMATPALRQLKRNTPLLRLHVECERGAGEILTANPYVDAVFEQARDRHRYTHTPNLNQAYERTQRLGIFKHPALAFCEVADVKFDGEPYELRIPEGLKAWAGGALL